jgi:hypothetical protein
MMNDPEPYLRRGNKVHARICADLIVGSSARRDAAGRSATILSVSEPGHPGHFGWACVEVVGGCHLRAARPPERRSQ